MYADAEDLITKGKALQAFLDKVRALEMEWTSSFAATVDAEPADPVIEETARKILSGSKASKTALLVRFPKPALLPASISALFTQSSRVCAEQPILAEIDWQAVQREE